MTVNVEFAGPVRRPEGVTGTDTTVQLGGTATTAGAVLEALGYAPHERRVLQVLRDGDRLADLDPVATGDRLVVLLRVGGG